MGFSFLQRTDGILADYKAEKLCAILVDFSTNLVDHIKRYVVSQPLAAL